MIPTKTPPGVEQPETLTDPAWLDDVIPTKTPPGVEQTLPELDNHLRTVVIPTKTPPGVEQMTACERIAGKRKVIPTKTPPGVGRKVQGKCLGWPPDRTTSQSVMSRSKSPWSAADDVLR